MIEREGLSLSELVSGIRDNLSVVTARLTNGLFGDRTGFTLFLGALCFLSLVWRVDFFINDNYTVANALVNVADGHLYIDHVLYGPETARTPGMNIVDERLYGRNYGHVFLSLPLLWVLEAIDYVADLRIALAGVWSLCLFAFCRSLGRLIGRRRELTLLGSVSALVLFGMNVWFATPLDSRWIALLSLQLSTMIAAGFTGVVMYRLLTAMHGQRIGIAAGFATVVATPVGFWGTIPKRHVPLALFSICTLYCFYRSRSADGEYEALRYRVSAYITAGLSAWISAPDALVLLVVLVPFDLLTANSNGRRQLSVIGAGFLISLLPFLLTNHLISGNAVQPPRMLPRFHGSLEELVQSTNPSNGGDTTSPSGEDVRSPSSTPSGQDGPPTGESVSTDERPEQPLFSVGMLVEGFLETIGWVKITLATTAGRLTFFQKLISQGITVLADDPERLYHVYIRSGRIPGVRYARDGYQTINLTMLESMPLVGGLCALPALAVMAIRERTNSTVRYHLRNPRFQTDLFAGGYIVVLTLMYLTRLPLYATITVRYLVPVMPMLLYLVCRLAVIRRIVQNHYRLLIWTYAGVLVIGGELLLIGLLYLSPTLGETMQLHALVNLVLAFMLALWVVVSTTTRRPFTQIGAVLLAGTAAMTTSFLLLAGWEYFALENRFLFPLVRVLGELIQII